MITFWQWLILTCGAFAMMGAGFVTGVIYMDIKIYKRGWRCDCMAPHRADPYD